MFTEYGSYFCRQSYILELIYSMLFFGAFLGDLTRSLYTDNYGRRNSLLLFLLGLVFGSLLITFAFNIFMIAFGLSFIAFGCNGCLGVLYTYLAEYVG